MLSHTENRLALQKKTTCQYMASRDTWHVTLERASVVYLWVQNGESFGFVGAVEIVPSTLPSTRKGMYCCALMEVIDK